MCFDVDSQPPITPIAGGSVDHHDLVLTSADGTEFAAFEAVTGSDAAVIVLPDVRGLFRFYEELALRFAEHGHDAIAIDYFGRTAGVEKRTNDWDYMPHVRSATLGGLLADVSTALGHVRKGDPDRSVFIVGFCFGGSNAWHMAASDLNLSGVVGFYGHPDRPDFPQGAPSVISRVADFSCPVRALQGGADPGIPAAVNASFRDAMAALDVDGEVIEYPEAPHSFFDRKQDEYAEASTDAWDRIQSFLANHG